MSILDRFLARDDEARVTPKVDPPKVFERGVGYCRNPDCEKFNQDSLMLGTVDVFFCPKCHAKGMVIKEISWPKDLKNMNFSEVRVEYNYQPSLEPYVHEGRFASLAIVRDESNPGQNVYNVRTALIRTEKQALKTAEGLLGNLAQHPEEVFTGRLGSRPRETIIDFDLPKSELRAKLQEFSERLSSSGLAKEEN